VGFGVCVDVGDDVPLGVADVLAAAGVGVDGAAGAAALDAGAGGVLDCAAAEGDCGVGPVVAGAGLVVAGRGAAVVCSGSAAADSEISGAGPPRPPLPSSGAPRPESLEPEVIETTCSPGEYAITATRPAIVPEETSRARFMLSSGIANEAAATASECGDVRSS